MPWCTDQSKLIVRLTESNTAHFDLIAALWMMAQALGNHVCVIYSLNRRYNGQASHWRPFVTISGWMPSMDGWPWKLFICINRKCNQCSPQSTEAKDRRSATWTDQHLVVSTMEVQIQENKSEWKWWNDKELWWILRAQLHGWDGGEGCIERIWSHACQFL